MKTIFVSAFLMLAAVSPILAQDLELKEELPVESLTMKKGNMPPAVLKSADQLFKGNTQVKWGVFPYQLKDFGWVVDNNYNEPIDHYEVYMKTTDGSNVYAVFESTGELISSRTISKNIALPTSVRNAIDKSGYKGWQISGDTEIIKSSQKKVVDHYVVRLTNGDKKKTLYFTTNGEKLENK